jgi:hypothetical protein
MNFVEMNKWINTNIPCLQLRIVSGEWKNYGEIDPEQHNAVYSSISMAPHQTCLRNFMIIFSMIRRFKKKKWFILMTYCLCDFPDASLNRKLIQFNLSNNPFSSIQQMLENFWLRHRKIELKEPKNRKTFDVHGLNNRISLDIPGWWREKYA